VRRSALPDSGIFNAAFLGMKALPKKLLPLTLIGIAVTSLFSVQPAQAFTVTLEQMGANVVATGSGAINLTGLTFVTQGSAAHGISGEGGSIAFGESPLDIYRGITGPTHFGTGAFVAGNDFSGDSFGIFGFSGLISVPEGYVSGNPLSASMTFDNATIHSLGLRPGTYTWTWGTAAGIGDQFFTVQIVGPTTVPDGGSTVFLLGCALLGLAALRRKLSC
jgi:hypothetical protein